MQINKIKKLKNGKYKLEIDHNKQLTTYDSVILENDLLFNKTIDKNTLEKIDISNNYYDIYNKVIKMVSKKIRSEKEIRDYLNENNLSEKDTDKMMRNLKENKIIDDEAFVRAFIHDRLSFSNDGPLKIREALEKNNIDTKIIDKELSLIDKEIYNEKIKKFVLKKISLNHKHSNLMLKYKITSELKSNGYSEFDIDEYFNDGNNEDLINKESNKIYKKLSKKYMGKELENKMYSQLYQRGFSKEEIQNVLENLGIFE